MNDLPTTAFGVLKQFSTSKDGVYKFSNQLIQSVKFGDVDALELKAYLKALENIVSIVDNATRKEQLSEAEKYAERKFNAFGFEIEVSEVGTSYDYSSCGDPVYQSREQEFNSSKQKLDERKEFLKALKEPLTVVDDQTGEVSTIRPPLKKSTTGLKFHLK